MLLNQGPHFLEEVAVTIKDSNEQAYTGGHGNRHIDTLASFVVTRYMLVTTYNTSISRHFNILAKNSQSVLKLRTSNIILTLYMVVIVIDLPRFTEWKKRHAVNASKG